MSIEKFLNIMRVQASLSSNGVAQTVLGKIVNYDPQSFYGMVELYAPDPTDSTAVPLTTGWLPICVPAIGWYPAPNIGDLVLVHFQEANQQNGFISLCSYTGQVGQQVPSGEWWFFRPDGSYLKFTNDGKIQISGNVEIDISAPVVNISGTINLGNLMAALTPLLTGAAATIFNAHIHTTPSGNSGVPTTTMGSGDMTTHVMGN